MDLVNDHPWLLTSPKADNHVLHAYEVILPLQKTKTKQNQINRNTESYQNSGSNYQIRENAEDKGICSTPPQRYSQQD